MLQIKNTLGGGKPEGLYVWKKYSIGFKYKEASVNKYENISIDTPQSGSIKVYAGSSYTFDENTGMYTLVDPSEYSVELNGASTTFANIYVTYKSPTSANMWIHNSTNYGFQVYNYTSSGVTLNRNSSDYPIMEYSAETEPTYTFLDYIVSDKETAFPDGGEKGGYWYEKIVDILGLLSCTKILVETFIPTRNISVGYGTYTLNHGLGEIPKYAILLSEGATASNTLTRMLWMYIGRSGDYQTSMYEYLDSSGKTSLGVYRNSKSQDSTATQITIGTDGSGQKLVAGIEYTLITMA